MSLQNCLIVLVLWSFTFYAAGEEIISETFIELANKLASEQSSSYSNFDSGLVHRQTGFDIPIKSILQSKKNTSPHIFNNVREELPPKVRTINGLVIGETNGDSYAFYSIPFGKPPIGPKRYLAPEPVESHADLDLSVPDYRSCWQQLSCEPDCESFEGNLTEDCLLVTINVPKTVNLSDPDSPPIERLPVLFWIHGGFFLFGSGTDYRGDARRLSRDANVVVVRVNYRLGALGFLSFQDGENFIEGNQGLKDQQLALQWVQDNIEKFGGDRERVTLFGNSAGGQAINFHLLSSVSEPLFKRAILQSSPTVFPYQTPQDFNKTITSRLLSALNCSNDPSCLRSVHPQDLNEVRGSMLIDSLREGDLFGAIEPFRPVIDGLEYKGQPLTLFKKGMWQSDKELMIGTVQEEMAYIQAIFENMDLPLPRSLFELLNTAVLGEENGKIMIDYYGTRSGLDYSDNFSQEITDFFFVCPNRALTRFASKTSTAQQKNIYLYNLAYPLSTETCSAIIDLPTVCGFAFHSSEPVLMFKSDHAYGISFTEEDRLVSDMISSYWGRFAYTGNPSSGDDIYPEEFTEWPLYSDTSENLWENIKMDDPMSTVESDFKQEICDLWDATQFYFEEEITTTAITSQTSFPAIGEEITTAITSQTSFPAIGEESTTTGGAKRHASEFHFIMLLYLLLSFCFLEYFVACK